MRGALQTLTRLNAANIGFTMAAFLALNAVTVTAAWARSQSTGSGSGTNSFPAAQLGAEPGDSVAYAVPRNAPLADQEVILPQPLPPSAVAQYGRIMALQARGEYRKADALISRLDDTTLVGPILADRYLSDNYISSRNELITWLKQYGSQPAAPAIYTLLKHKSPLSAVLPPTPRPILLPETTLTAGAAARPSAQGDGASWRRIFMAGLQDWQRGDIARAQPLFMRAANMHSISDDSRAAADFWAARAALREQQPEDYLNWLRLAASTDDTFYGMLAARLLGEGFGPTGIAATLTEADIVAVDATPDGHLAFALLQIGQTDQAELALRALWPSIQTNPDFGHSVMAVAARAGLVDVAIAIAGQLPGTGNDIADARLPLPAMHPTGGFTVDPSLIYALTRTESGFNNLAVSPAGARGLMQLMPVTAHFIARHQGISGGVGDPSANLALGQGYIHYLGQQPGINQNLLAILASYNAGPGAAALWYNALQQDSDPLLFIETIPNDATRRFVRQVLADSWIYAQEIGLRPSSLEDIAEGNFPQLSNLSTVATIH
jgi:soluble lytic murein transglycosylase-like protein